MHVRFYILVHFLAFSWLFCFRNKNEETSGIKRANQNESLIFFRRHLSVQPKKSSLPLTLSGWEMQPNQSFQNDPKNIAQLEAFGQNKPPGVKFNSSSLCLEISFNFGQKIALVLTRNLKAVNRVKSLDIISDRAHSFPKISHTTWPRIIDWLPDIASLKFNVDATRHIFPPMSCQVSLWLSEEFGEVKLKIIDNCASLWIWLA